MRSMSDVRLGAINRVSFAYLTRRRGACLAGGDDFLDELAAEIEFVRQHRPDLTTVYALGVARDLGILHLLPRLPMTASTAALTYMGDWSDHRHYTMGEDGRFRMGNLIVEYVAAAPWGGGNARATLGVCRIGQRLSLGLHCDSEWLSPEDERELLERYVTAWRGWGGILPTP